MVTFLRDAVPNIVAVVVGVVLALIVAVGVFAVVDASAPGKNTVPHSTTSP